MSKQPDAVAKRLQLAIQGGEFSPGQPLPSERVLSQQWGISRSIIREGIAMLVARGLLTRVQGRGTFVNAVEEQMDSQVWADIATDLPGLQDHMLEFRQLLEGRAAQLAAARHSAEDRRRLKEAGEAVDQAWREGGAREQLRTDLALHQCIAQATHNPVISSLMSSLHRLLLEHMQLSVAGHVRDPQVNAAVRDQHQTLVAAILSRDLDAAGRAAEDHLDFVRVRLNHLRPRGS